MKRYNIRIHTWTESWYDGEFSELQTNESKAGEWVKATDALKLQDRIERMQKRIDKLEGRIHEFVGVDIKDVIIEDLRRTLGSLERTLRAAGSIEFKCYHNARDRELAGEFLKMADAARASLDFEESLK